MPTWRDASASRPRCAVRSCQWREPCQHCRPLSPVIGADGSLTGYGGGLDRKRWLLDHEKQAVECAEDSVVLSPALPW